MIKIKSIKHLIALSLFLIILLPRNIEAQSYSTIKSNSLHLGSRSVAVSDLQRFLAKDISIYPEAIISGYFGNLTKNAVVRFQAKYNLNQDGWAGIGTIGKINQLISSNTFNNISTAYPISNVSVQTTNNSANISFSAHAPTTAVVIYSAEFPTMSEATEITGPAKISGIRNSDNQISMNHTITIGNLKPNTNYYYTIETTDSVNNVNMTWPTTFKTL